MYLHTGQVDIHEWSLSQILFHGVASSADTLFTLNKLYM